MDQVERGKTEEEGLGEFSHYYALLMKCASILYHDTIKGIAALNNKNLFNRADKYCDDIFRIGKEESNAKVKAAKQIEVWAKMVEDALTVLYKSRKFTTIQKFELEEKILGRVQDTYRVFTANFELAWEQKEVMNDLVDLQESLQNLHEEYVQIVNSNLREEIQDAKCFALLMTFIREFFEKVEGLN